MYSKIVFFAAAICVAAARPQAGHGHGHEYGHAISSQSIVLHQTHHAPQHHQSTHAVPHHEHHEEHHGHGHGHATSSQSIVLHQTQHAPQHHQQSTHETHHNEHHEEHHGHPKYEFAYEVEDKHTGDIKSQHESRDGNVVKGYYSLHEADGTVRIVHYTADKHNGFNAIVERKGHAKHIEPVHHHH